MALLFCDSFDHYATAQGAQKWDIAFPASAGIITTNPRTGTRSLEIIGAFGPTKGFASKATVIFGTALYPNILPPSPTASEFVIFKDLTAGVDQVKLGLMPDGSIRAFRNTTVLGVSAAGVVPAASYSYIEAAVTISTSAGSIVVKVNGVTVLTLTNVNTDASLSGFVNGLQLMSLGGAAQWVHDDVYLCDDLGGVNNTFLGQVKIYMEVPTSDSAPLQWTPSTGVTHFALVDEVPPNTTDYNSDGTVGQIDQYLYPATSIPSPATIVGIQHVMSAALDVAGARTVASCVDGINGAEEALSTSYIMIVAPYDSKPGGGAWVEADVTITAFGPEVTA